MTMLKRTLLIVILAASFCTFATAAPRDRHTNSHYGQYHLRHGSPAYSTKHYRSDGHHNYKHYYSHRYTPNHGHSYRYSKRSYRYGNNTFKLPHYRGYRPGYTRPGYLR